MARRNHIIYDNAFVFTSNRTIVSPASPTNLGHCSPVEPLEAKLSDHNIDVESMTQNTRFKSTVASI
jgi:hypothetical protein